MTALHIGTKNNVERTGDRNDLALSNAMRLVEGAKHMDLDLMQMSAKTGRVQIVFEATSNMGWKATTWSRGIAKQLGAYTVLVQHEWQDKGNQFPIYVTIWDDEGNPLPEFKKDKMTWADLVDVCEQIRDIMDEKNPDKY